MKVNVDAVGEAQLCFRSGPFMICNFVVRQGYAISSNSGKWMKFPVYGKVKKKEVVNQQNEKTSHAGKQKEV